MKMFKEYHALEIIYTNVIHNSEQKQGMMETRSTNSNYL